MVEASVVAVAMITLYGFLKWLDRVHPPGAPQSNPTAELERKFQELREEVDELKLGKSLRNED